MEREIDRALMGIVKQGLGMSEAEEDGMWERFQARRLGEAAAWSAFVGAIVRMSRNLRPAMQACAWPGPFYRGIFSWTSGLNHDAPVSTRPRSSSFRGILRRL